MTPSRFLSGDCLVKKQPKNKRTIMGFVWWGRFEICVDVVYIRRKPVTGSGGGGYCRLWPALLHHVPQLLSLCDSYFSKTILWKEKCVRLVHGLIRPIQTSISCMFFFLIFPWIYLDIKKGFIVIKFWSSKFWEKKIAISASIVHI